MRLLAYQELQIQILKVSLHPPDKSVKSNTQTLSLSRRPVVPHLRPSIQKVHSCLSFQMDPEKGPVIHESPVYDLF